MEGLTVPTITRRTNRDRTITYLAQVRIAGFKPVSKAHPTLKEAKAWAAALETELRKHGKSKSIRPDVATLTLRGLIDEHLADTDTRGKLAFEDHSRLLAWWMNKHGGERVREFGVLQLRAARDSLKPGRAPSTVNRYVGALRTCWNWGRSAGIIANDNIWPTRLMLTEAPARQRYLNDEELADLLAKAKEHSAVVYAAIVVSIATGIRQGELLRMKWVDVDLNAQRLTLMKTKSGKPRTVHVPAVAIAALKELRKASVVGLNVFLNQSGQPLRKGQLESEWGDVRTAAKLEDFRWHDLRHSCASLLAQNGATLLEIGSVLGHSSPSVTQRYAHLVQGKAVTGHDQIDIKLGQGEDAK